MFASANKLAMPAPTMSSMLRIEIFGKVNKWSNWNNWRAILASLWFALFSFFKLFGFIRFLCSMSIRFLKDAITPVASCSAAYTVELWIFLHTRAPVITCLSSFCASSFLIFRIWEFIGMFMNNEAFYFWSSSLSSLSWLLPRSWSLSVPSSSLSISFDERVHQGIIFSLFQIKFNAVAIFY